MNSTMNLLLRAAIAAAASDREKFVDRVSSLIEEKTGASPEKAETIAGNIDKIVPVVEHYRTNDTPKVILKIRIKKFH